MIMSDFDGQIAWIATRMDALDKREALVLDREERLEKREKRLEERDDAFEKRENAFQKKDQAFETKKKKINARKKDLKKRPRKIQDVMTPPLTDLIQAIETSQSTPGSGFSTGRRSERRPQRDSQQVSPSQLRSANLQVPPSQDLPSSLPSTRISPRATMASEWASPSSSKTTSRQPEPLRPISSTVRNPPGLGAAGTYVNSIWRQMDLRGNWDEAASHRLLDAMIGHIGITFPLVPGRRFDQAIVNGKRCLMERLACGSGGLYDEVIGVEVACRAYEKCVGLCMEVSWYGSVEPGPFDAEGMGKRWVVVKRWAGNGRCGRSVVLL